ncbi:MAG: class I SAM-dependent rRNA methyltransferase [Myxococcales bacterium]|nr:class I SAM-dependent rRNA methyltransferase [Myxococcales bacterium]
MVQEIMETAWLRRQPLLDALHAEETEAYRLFHGAVEGMPKVTVDRYGPLLMIQSFGDPLNDEERDAIGGFWQEKLPDAKHLVYNHRTKGAKQDFSPWHQPSPEALVPMTCKEMGLTFRVQGRHRGIDPLFFLDMRAGRRWMRAHAKGASVLNLFAYTCTMGIVAAAAGAREVWNVDFASSNLTWGRENAECNGLTEGKSLRFLHEDAIPVMRQLAGLPIKGKASRRSYTRFSSRTFDIVFLDPPRFARTPFGAVDLVRDYQSLFKPALLATSPGGSLVAVNNVAEVDLEEWRESLIRCAQKSEKPLEAIEILSPEEDFPSFDGKHPLKIALCRLPR